MRRRTAYITISRLYKTIQTAMMGEAKSTFQTAKTGKTEATMSPAEEQDQETPGPCRGQCIVEMYPRTASVLAPE